VCGAVAVILLLTGCCTTPRPDVSLAAILPKLIEDGFALAGPEYTVYDLTKLRIGMTKAEVYELFSGPHVIKHAPKDEYWEYDWFELYFREGRLVNWFDLPAPRRKAAPIRS
jgi:outer membrane protein assembly factor BamE (lipoprotein component of BamABCDE complex)